MSSTEPRDFFDKARSVAGALLLAAGAAAVLGAMLDWVAIAPPQVVPPEQADRLATFAGIETSDGRVIAAGGLALVACAVALTVRKRALYAWLAFVASIVIGAIAIADYRDITGVFYDEMQRIGRPSPAFGLQLDAASGIVGLVGSLIGVAASPSRGDDSG